MLHTWNTKYKYNRRTKNALHLKYKDRYQKKPIIIQILNNTDVKKQTPLWTAAG